MQCLGACPKIDIICLKKASLVTCQLASYICVTMTQHVVASICIKLTALCHHDVDICGELARPNEHRAFWTYCSADFRLELPRLTFFNT